MTFETTRNKLKKLWQKTQGNEDTIEKVDINNTINDTTFKKLKSIQSLTKRIRDISPDWVQMNTITQTLFEDANGNTMPKDDFSGKYTSENASNLVIRESIFTLYYTWRIELGDIHEDNLIFLNTAFLFKFPNPENEEEVDFNLLKDTIRKNVFFEVHDIPNPANIGVVAGGASEPDADYPIKHVYLCADVYISTTDTPPDLPETEVKFLVQVVNKNYIQ